MLPGDYKVMNKLTILIVLAFLGNEAISAEFTTTISIKRSFKAVLMSNGFNIPENLDYESVFDGGGNEMELCYLGSVKDAKNLFDVTIGSHNYEGFQIISTEVKGNLLQVNVEDHEDQEAPSTNPRAFAVRVCR